MLLNAFLFVLGIEVFQLFSAFGAFDVDDILLNCVGAIIGYLFYFPFEALRGRYQNKQKSHRQRKKSSQGNRKKK